MKKVFLSYASEDRVAAENIWLALEAEGHTVFYDRVETCAGEPYHQKIREEIAHADTFVFLITPTSLGDNRYTLTELKLARERWRRPSDGVVPVMLQDTPLGDVPQYLKTVGLLRIKGDPGAEVAAHLAADTNRTVRSYKRHPKTTGAVTIGALALAVTLALPSTSEERLVTHVVRDTNQRILALCAPGKSWSPRPRNDVIRDIQKQRHSYFVYVEGHALAPILVSESTSGAFLRTASDTLTENNLSNLPKCPG